MFLLFISKKSLLGFAVADRKYGSYMMEQENLRNVPSPPPAACDLDLVRYKWFCLSITAAHHPSVQCDFLVGSTKVSVLDVFIVQV